MSICLNVTERDLNNLGLLAELLRNQRAIKILKKSITKAHDKKLA